MVGGQHKELYLKGCSFQKAENQCSKHLFQADGDILGPIIGLGYREGSLKIVPAPGLSPLLWNMPQLDTGIINITVPKQNRRKKLSTGLTVITTELTKVIRIIQVSIITNMITIDNSCPLLSVQCTPGQWQVFLCITSMNCQYRIQALLIQTAWQSQT